MEERKLRWGVIGTSNIARKVVIPALHRARNGELVAVASRDLDRARAFAADTHIPRAYGTYEHLLEAGDIDAVYIPLPNSLHMEWTIKAAQAGKHILCEKPMALNATQCLEMVAAAEQHGVVLMEAFMYRFHPRFAQALAMLRDGVIGEPTLIQSAFTFRVANPQNIRFRPDLGGGSLMDVGCYCVNASRTLAGAEPIEVQAYANWGPSGVDEVMAGTLRFASGLLAQFTSALTLDRVEFYQVSGPDGSLEVQSAFLPGTGDVAILEHRGRQGTVTHTISGVDEYQVMVEHYAESVLNRKPVRYPPTEAAANMRVIEALLRSARNEGRPELL